MIGCSLRIQNGVAHVAGNSFAQVADLFLCGAGLKIGGVRTGIEEEAVEDSNADVGTCRNRLRLGACDADGRLTADDRPSGLGLQEKQGGEEAKRYPKGTDTCFRATSAAVF